MSEIIATAIVIFSMVIMAAYTLYILISDRPCGPCPAVLLPVAAGEPVDIFCKGRCACCRNCPAVR